MTYSKLVPGSRDVTLHIRNSVSESDVTWHISNSMF